MGNVIDLSAGGNIGSASQNAYASLGYNAAAKINLCHGVNLEFSAEARAQAGVSAQMFHYIQGVLAVEGGVEAGVKIAAQCSGDVTDNLGLVASVQAYLKAYIRARLELGLSASAILRAVEPTMTPLQFEIFEAFVDQLEIQVGVQGNMQVALTATAEVVAQARLVEDPTTDQLPGFDFRANAEAAFLFGAGFDFFAKARFNDIKRFFTTVKDVMIFHIEDRVATQTNLPDDDRYLLFSLWRKAMDFIIDGSSKDKGAFAKRAEATLTEVSKDFLWTVLVSAFAKAITKEIENANTWLVGNQNTIAGGIQLVSRLKTLVDSIVQAQNVRELLAIFDQVIAILEGTGFSELESLKQIGTDIHILGFLQDKAKASFWEMIPSYVQDVYSDVTGVNITKLSTDGQALSYLERSPLATKVINTFDQGTGFVTGLQDLLHQKNILIAEFLLLVFDPKTPARKQERLAIGFDLLSGIFENHIAPKLQNEIKGALPNAEHLLEHVTVLIDDLSSSFTKIFMPLFKLVVVQGGNTADQERLAFMANRFLMQLLMKNVTAISTFFLKNAVNTVDTNVIRMKSKLNQPEFDQFGKEFFTRLEDFIDIINPFPLDADFDTDFENELIKATRGFMRDILDVAKTSMGSQTWTDSRVQRLTSSLELLTLGPDGDVIDFSTLSLAEIQTKVDQLRDCDFLPSGVEDELAKIIETLSTIGLAQLKAYLFDLPKAIIVYLIKVFTIIFTELVEEILELLYELGVIAYEALKETIKKLKEAIAKTKEELIALGKDLVQFAENLYDAVEQRIIDFFDELKLDLDLDDLGFLESIFNAISSLFGDTDEEKARDVVEQLKKEALKNLKNRLSVSQIERLAKEGPVQFGKFSRAVGERVFLEDLREDLRKINFKSSRSIDDRIFTTSRGASIEQAALDDVALEYRAKRTRLEIDEEDLINKTKQELQYSGHFERLEELELSNIRVLSPVPLDVAKNDTPMYGEIVHLEIDFDKLDIKKVIDTRMEIDPEDLIDRVEKKVSNQRLKDIFSAVRNKHTLGFLETHIFVNGKEVNLETVNFSGNKIITNLKRPTIKEGKNILMLCVTPPSSQHRHAVTIPITFFCDFKDRKIPTNGVYINLEKSVINSIGNDHLDAVRNSQEDKEKIVITNGTEDVLDTEGWSLQDARGHTFTFSKDSAVKPGLDRTVYIGSADGAVYEWHEEYRGKPIAVLNNNGEMLILRDTEGRVISQVFTGNPKSNKDIKFATASKPRPVS